MSEQTLQSGPDTPALQKDWRYQIRRGVRWQLGSDIVTNYGKDYGKARKDYDAFCRNTCETSTYYYFLEKHNGSGPVTVIEKSK
jgi:hypothetical protein